MNKIVLLACMMLFATVSCQAKPTPIVIEKVVTAAAAPRPTGTLEATVTATIPPHEATRIAEAWVAMETRVAKPTLTPQCAPTDQDAYVYYPNRLAVQSACIRVTGVVRRQPYIADDGDAIIDLDLDEEFKQHLVPGNFTNFGGALHTEIICYDKPSDSAAATVCSLNSHPLSQPLPNKGQRLWMEGRWVLDEIHGGHAELHPVYRWGVLP